MYDFDHVTDRRNTASLKWDVKENELPMWVADMDFETAPAVKEAVLRRAESGVYGYAIIEDGWYDAVIDWWKTRHGLELEKEWLCFSTGVVPAISSMVQRLSEVGDSVVLLTPVYDIFFHSVENFGRHVAECPLLYRGGVYEIDFAALEKAFQNPLATLCIFCNPHNPVGKIFTKEQLVRVGELAKTYGVTVISDEIHCDVVSEKRGYVPFFSASEACREVGVTCLSASKAFNVAGLQSAIVAVKNPVLRARVFRGLNSNEVAEPNCFAAVATEAAFRKGGAWLDELCAYLFKNRASAETFIEKEIPEIFAVKGEATYLLWIDVTRVTDDAETFAGFLREKTGLYLSAGNQYRGNGAGFLRMNLACPASVLLDGLDRLKRGTVLYLTEKEKAAERI